MAATPVFQKTVARLIATLTGISDISSVIGTRAYGAHLSTVQNPTYPAVSMFMLEGSRFVDQAGIETFLIQIDIWMNAAGADPKVWDDVMQLAADIGAALHGNSFTDQYVRLLKVSQAGQGPMMYESEGDILHLPTRWTVRAVAA